MKKHIVAIVLFAGLSMATVASAGWGRGWNGDGNCPMMGAPMMQGQMMQQLEPAAKEKVVKFFKDNQALQKQIVMKQAEKRAIMQSDKPDPQAASKVAGELFDLRSEMFTKAEAAGVSQYIGPMGGKGFRGPGARMGKGAGMGMGNGPGMGKAVPQQ